MNTRSSVATASVVAGLCAASTHAQFCNFESLNDYSIPGNLGGADPSYIDSGDIDGDGDIDLITDSNGPGNDPTQIFWNDGAGNFSLGPALISGWGFGEVSLGDMDGDGDLDVLRCNYFSNGVYFFRNNGDGSFESGIFYSGGGGCQVVEFVDFDNDGDLDFITVDKFGQKIRPYRNINGLGFTSVGLFDCGGQPGGLDVGDVDNDGDADVIVSDEDGNTVTVVYNAGDGTFPTNQSFAVGEMPVGVILEDLNGDGNLDAVATNWDDLAGIGNTVSVLIGDGTGSFAPEQRYMTGAAPRDVQASDLNGDGFLDLVVACQIGDVISLLPGNGDGTFGDTQTLEYGTNPHAVALDDHDGDGAIDIAYIDNTLSRLYTLGNDCDTPVDPPVLNVNWQIGYDNSFNIDQGKFVSVNDQGEVIVGGTTTFNANEEDFLVTKFDAQGNLLWDAVYNGDGDHYDQPGFMGLDGEGNIFIAGQSWGSVGLGAQWAVVKYDTDGNQLWVRRYDGGNPMAQQSPRGFAIGPNGEFAMTGWARDASFQNIYMGVVCYDAMGNQMFDATFPSSHSGDASAQGEAITFDPDGNVIATGYGNDDDESGDEMITAKIDPAGTVLWEERLDLATGAQSNTTHGRAVTTDGAGNIFVAATASVSGTSENDAAIVLYASDGAVIDTVFDTQPGNSFPTLFTWIAPDQLLMTGSGGGGVRAANFDPAGSFQWSRVIEARTTSENKYGHVALSNDGFLYFIDQDGGDLAVEQWSTAGEFQSRTRLDTGATLEYPNAIAAGPGGHLFVAGVYNAEIVNRDDVLLYDLVSDEIVSCIPDLTGDGLLDFFDVSAFLNGYAAQDPIADLDKNGKVDFFDVSIFLNAFNAGCP